MHTNMFHDAGKYAYLSGYYLETDVLTTCHFWKKINTLDDFYKMYTRVRIGKIGRIYAKKNLLLDC